MYTAKAGVSASKSLQPSLGRTRNCSWDCSSSRLLQGEDREDGWAIGLVQIAIHRLEDVNAVVSAILQEDTVIGLQVDTIVVLGAFHLQLHPDLKGSTL